MTRGKGERPVAIHLDSWSAAHPVYNAIATGDHRFAARIRQKATPAARLSKMTGIPGSRLLSLSTAGSISRAEVDALARTWVISSSDLIASIANRTTIIE